jgi:hypothetical protein
MKKYLFILTVSLTFFHSGCSSNSAITEKTIDYSQDELIETARYPNGEIIPYVITTANLLTAKYALILMPGGVGELGLERRGKKVGLRGAKNFLIRARGIFADNETIAISTDSTGVKERMEGILNDLQKRYPSIRVYIIGTSRSTISTMQLAEKLDGIVAGFVYTSSMSSIAGFDTRKLTSRQLIVHHYHDGCHVTGYGAAKGNHDQYGTDFITMDGGIGIGDPCDPFANHGYYGIEKETVDKIKEWIKKDVQK